MQRLRYIAFLLISIGTIVVSLSCTNSGEDKSRTARKVTTSTQLLNKKTPGIDAYERLSDYGFFKGKLSDLNPAEDVIPYDLNSSLFSDYAEKARFVKFPKGEKASYHSSEVIEFPLGTILIKNFYYPADFRNPEGEREIVETRLLIHKKDGWQALPYIWNEDQTDAYLKITGGNKQVSWIDRAGNKNALTYSVPNLNQCRSCHLMNDKITPIGPSARQLNKDFDYDGKKKTNQLAHWKTKGYLADLPEHTKAWPKLVNYNNTNTGIDARARAYLEINCGHCHRKEGPAKNSALELLSHIKNPAAWGIGKTPIAAGKGSGGLKYDISPGEPHQSILLYRMNSTDPGIMMPELGRKMIHEEGVELIREWITEMK